MILFTIPRDYAESVEQEYAELDTLVFSGKAGKFPWLLPSPEDVTTWVCSPVQQEYITGEHLDFFPNLKILATASTGTNHIDLEACKRRGVKVLSLLDDRAGLDTISASAEFTFKLLIDALRIPPARELRNKNVGLVGYGRIGKRLHRYCGAFSANVIKFDPYTHGSASSVERIFEWSDAVIICCSLTDETRGMIDAKLLRSMKHGAALVNTARGEIINEQDLYTVLMERPDIRFATDVVHGEVEGRGEESREKLRARDAIVTPHIAGETFDSRTKAARIILELLKKELNNAKATETGLNHV